MTTIGTPAVCPYGGGDCNDGDPNVHPGATEIVDNGIDDNCDGNELCYLDDDGYRPDGTSTVYDDGDLACTGSGEAQSTDPIGDCDDGNANVHPGATEICDDLIDNDCDGYRDGDDPDCEVTIPIVTIISPEAKYYSVQTLWLNVSANMEIDKWWYSVNSGDNQTFEPNTLRDFEQCRNDLTVYANNTEGTESSDSVSFYALTGDVDRDRDVDIFDIVKCAGSYGFTTGDPKFVKDCDFDYNEIINIFDIVSMAGKYGEECPVCVDNDKDGYGNPADNCLHPELDCNDTDASVNPGAEEVCDDGVDNDCDGDTDLDKRFEQLIRFFMII
jgi:hypothetical protein